MSKAELEDTQQKGCRGTEKIDLSLLEAEISFWQEMIKFRDASMTEECLERMQQALALAQSRLKDSVATRLSAPHCASQAGENVYFIDDRRN